MRYSHLRRAAFAALLLTISAPAHFNGKITCHWLPTRSLQRGVMHEGITVETPGMEPILTVEGEADGKPLETITGRPDRYGFIAAPIRNLDTYKLRKLTIVAGRGSWELVDPKQEFELVLPEGR